MELIKIKKDKKNNKKTFIVEMTESEYIQASNFLSTNANGLVYLGNGMWGSTTDAMDAQKPIHKQSLDVNPIPVDTTGTIHHILGPTVVTPIDNTATTSVSSGDRPSNSEYTLTSSEVNSATQILNESE